MIFVQVQGLIKLKGIIQNYRCTRAEASFVFTDNDKNAMGVVAIAAAIAGLSGSAVATAANAMSTEEDADYIEFDLNGKAVKGWVWRSPFKEGDVIEAAVEQRDKHYELAGMARSVDRVIALYPHCSRGRLSHTTNALKYWLLGTIIFISFMVAIALPISGIDGLISLFIGTDDEQVFYVWIGVAVFFGLMTFSLTRKWMPFARLAEKVFKTLNFPTPEKIDLVKSSRIHRKPGDPDDLGIFYFRY